MITKLTGRLQTLGDDHCTVQLGGLEYEVLIPEFARLQLQTRLGQDVVLHTIQYLEGNAMQGRLVPRLVGFLNPAEREFFELFCSVDGVGARKALRAMVRPVREVAEAIEEQDVKFLSALPGIGPAVSERIVAKLRRKMPKFALLVARDVPDQDAASVDVVSATFDLLRSLGHSESDARRLIDAALSSKRKYKDVEDLIRAIYQQSHEGAQAAAAKTE